MARSCIGLDLGSSSVKVAQLGLGRRSGEVKLLAFGVEPIAPDAIVDGTIMNQSAVVDAVRALMGRLKLKQKDVALAISGHSVIIKKILVPAMTDEELEEQIPWEAEQHIPFDKNYVELDYQVLSGKNAQGQMELLLVAAKKEVVRDYTAVAREAQLNPVVVDIAAFALQNAYETAYQNADSSNPSDAVVLINVGAAISHINILTGGATAFTRDVNAGGTAFTDEIKRHLGVSHEEAEAMKAAIAAGEGNPEIERVLHQVAETMAGEFSKSLDFFLASHRDTNVTKIYLAGGGAKVAELHRAIEQRAHTPVEMLDPFRRMDVAEAQADQIFLHDHRSEAAISVGLALRTPGDKFA
jgi:type IV pilus assembly protein PilM